MTNLFTLCAAIVVVFAAIISSSTIAATTLQQNTSLPQVDSYAVYDSRNNSYSIITAKEFNASQSKDFVSRIRAQYTVNTTGWNMITLSPNRALLDSGNEEDALRAYYASGLLEGFVFCEEAISALYNIGLLTSGGEYRAAFPRDSSSGANIGSSSSAGGSTQASSNSNEERFREFVADTWKSLKNDYNDCNTVTCHGVRRFVRLIEGYCDGINRRLVEMKSTAPPANGLLCFYYSAQASTADYMTASAAPPPTPAPPPATMVPFAQGMSTSPPAAPAAPPTTSDAASSFSYFVNHARANFGSHCSALVKMTKDDLGFAHTTWGTYAPLGDRAFKVYEFETTISMSSYVISIASMDSFYVTGHNLAVLETTLLMDNLSMTKEYVTPQLVPVMMRVMTANIWGSTVEEWKDIFLEKNQGDYCCSWILVDYKLVDDDVLKAQKLKDKTVYMVEQLPGPYSQVGDVTDIVNSASYIASYNIGHFDKTYDLTLEKYACDVEGSLFCRTNYSRPEIFARDAPKIVEQQGVKDLIRYNNWQNDPLSRIPRCSGCNPANNPQLAIANRADLVPFDANFGNSSPFTATVLANAAFGATDAKFVNYKGMNMKSKSAQVQFISGPTTSNGLPPFSWANYIESVPAPKRFSIPRHLGAINEFNFDWQTSTVSLTFAQKAPWPISGNGSSGDNGSSGGGGGDGIGTGAVIGCVVAGCVLVLAAAGFLYRHRRRQRDAQYAAVGDFDEKSLLVAGGKKQSSLLTGGSPPPQQQQHQTSSAALSSPSLPAPLSSAAALNSNANNSNNSSGDDDSSDDQGSSSQQQPALPVSAATNKSQHSLASLQQQQDDAEDVTNIHSTAAPRITVPRDYAAPASGDLASALKADKFLRARFKHLDSIVAGAFAVARDTEKKQQQRALAHPPLDLDECFTLALYSFDIGTGVPEDNFYFALNYALRRREEPSSKQLLEALTPYFLVFDKAWAKLPPQKRRVFRGIPMTKSVDTVRREMQAGRVLSWYAVTSASTDEKVADQFGSGTERGIMFVVSTVDARSIAEYSAIPTENELVLPPGTQLMVIPPPAGYIERVNKNTLVVFAQQMQPESNPFTDAEKV